METIEAEVREFATQTNLLVWEGIPWGGATTLTPESQSLADFLAIARAVGAPILYLDPDGSAAAFLAGVPRVPRLAALTPDADATAKPPGPSSPEPSA